MAKHLPGKVARIISDFLTLAKLIELIEHEMEKRIVARHGLVKLDALLNLLSRLKNEIKVALPQAGGASLTELTRLIKRLRKDLENSDLETGRDTLAAHALQLDIRRLVEAWTCMGATTFGVLEQDLIEIDKELRRLSKIHPNVFAYPGGASHIVKSEWRDIWRNEGYLGDPMRPRVAVIYPGIGTANIVSIVPGGNPDQDALIRATGLATFLRQVRLMLQAVPKGGEVERLFAEIMVNDYFALWELLFTSCVQNTHGPASLCLLDYWLSGDYGGASDLSNLKAACHHDFENWRTQIRNKCSAHVDADMDIWSADLQHWPMTVDELIDEALRVVTIFAQCAQKDIRSKYIMIIPTICGPEVVGLSGQKGKLWCDG